MTYRGPAMSSIPNAIDWQQAWFQRWEQELHWSYPSAKHRKLFEFCVILETLEREGLLKYQKKGLGFGVGNEPVASILAKYKVKVLASDYDPETAKKHGWSSVHVGAAYRTPEIIDEDAFNRYVSYREIDMNNIPNDVDGFDFLWSSCSLEHLGSRQHGIEFVVNAMDCLNPGGIAVHTTEFSWGKGFDAYNLALYSEADLKNLRYCVESIGCTMDELSFASGNTPEDLYVSKEPHGNVQPHLRLEIAGQKATSCLLVVRKP